MCCGQIVAQDPVPLRYEGLREDLMVSLLAALHPPEVVERPLVRLGDLLQARTFVCRRLEHPQSEREKRQILCHRFSPLQLLFGLLQIPLEVRHWRRSLRRLIPIHRQLIVLSIPIER